MRIYGKNKNYNIPWKFKSFIFSWISFFNASKFLYFLQRYVTKRSRIGNLVISPNWQIHKNSLKQYKTTDVIYEFGAGKTLVENLYISDIVKKQFVVDLYSMIEFDLVDSVRKKLMNMVKFRSKVKIKSLRDLQDYGIYYIAPYDTTKTHLGNKSIDACISTNTLEHIPKSDIISIFNELHRILKDEGIISAIIDYSDHYAHTDDSISLLNFLKFTPHQWKKYNHKFNFQNRLRHYEYINIFKNAGFTVIKENLIYAEKNIPYEVINSYENFDPTWKATSAHIILKKKP